MLSIFVSMLVLGLIFGFVEKALGLTEPWKTGVRIVGFIVFIYLLVKLLHVLGVALALPS